MHRHKYILKDFKHVRDISYWEPGDPYTRILLVCEICDKIKTRRIEGHWDLEKFLEKHLTPPDFVL